jgi:hypothetical protein
MNAGVDAGFNPYGSPEEVGPSITEQMECLRTRYEGRYGQLAEDAALIGAMSATCATLAWLFTHDRSYASISAAVPAMILSVESIRDLIANIRDFPVLMQELRHKATAEWSKGEIDY